MNFNISQIIALVKPFIGLGGNAAHSFVERAVTPPKKDMEQLCSGMSAEDKAEAIRLRNVFADAASDFSVFVASRGTIDAD